MEETLNKFAAMHNIEPLSVKILMNLDGNYYKWWTAMVNGELMLHPNAVLKLEQTLDQLSTISIPVSIIHSVVPHPEAVDDILSGKVENITVESVSDENEVFVIGTYLDAIVKYAINPDKMTKDDPDTKDDPKGKQTAADIDKNDKKLNTDETISDSETESIPDSSEVKGKRQRRKKTPCAMPKTFFSESGFADASDVKLIRQFLLSLPNFKIEDIALMDDLEVINTCNQKYYCISSGDNLILFPRELILEVSDEINVLKR